ncbi:kelch-like protein 41 isoform X2 [Dermatophagoides pteronyssinus]
MCQHFFHNKNEWKKFQKNSPTTTTANYQQQRDNHSNLSTTTTTTSIVISEMNDSLSNSSVVHHRGGVGVVGGGGRRNLISSSSSFVNRQQPNSNELSPSLPLPIVNQQNIMSVVPSAPSIGHDLFNNENEADIVFLVGPDKNKLWRFPAHSSFLKNVSQYFATITNDPNNNNNKEIKIDWCDPEIFEIILKYAYLEQLTLNSVEKTLKIFETSNRFQLFSLSKHCLTFLFDQCNNENVIKQLSFFKHYFQILPLEKYSPTHHMISKELLEPIMQLLRHCFNVIDMNCNKILDSDEFLLLSNQELIVSILSRDTLNIDSELDIYNALCRWSNHQCKQQRLELTAENKRKVLGDLIYLPRYLIMKRNEFIDGPYKDEILKRDEKEILLKILNNDDNIELPDAMKPYKMRIARHYDNTNNDCDNNNDNNDDQTTNIQPKLTKSLSYEKGFNEKKKRSVQKRFVKGFVNVMVLIIRVLD